MQKERSFLDGGGVGWSDTSDDWLVKLMIIIIVIIIDHCSSSRVSLFLYIFLKIPKFSKLPALPVIPREIRRLEFLFSQNRITGAGTGVIYLPQI